MKLGVTLGLAALLVNGCFGNAERACTTGADCASGQCRVDGTCAPAPSADAGALRDGSSGGSGGDALVSMTDAGAVTSEASALPDTGIAPPKQDAAAGCVPNKDGIIVRQEVPLAAGFRATYRVAQNAAVSMAGVSKPDGTRTWDLSGALAGDHTLLVETTATTGQWFDPEFAGAAYSARLSDSSNLLGVFGLSPTAILLRGVVSPTDGASKTDLKNATEVAVLSFPMKLTSTWKTQTNVTGYAQGILAAYTELYESEVDAAGSLVTPYGTFAVLRVNTLLTRTVGALPTKTRTFAFVSECFGPVATVVSQSNEAQVEFTTAAEVQRLSP